MAELLLKVGDRSADPADYKDGDILCAFNRRRIRCVHAESICHVRKAQRNASGLILLSEPSRDWYEATHEYRFERVSATEMRRTMIATGESEILSDRPNAKGEYIDVRAFIERRKRRRNKHYLFGEDGAEVWYGGTITADHPRLDVVWNAIETKTPLRERDHGLWPAGEQELRSHLFVRTTDFDDAEAESLVASEVDDSDPDNPVVVQKRERTVDWKARLGLNAGERADIEDRSKRIDFRDRQPRAIQSIVDVKPSRRPVTPPAPRPQGPR